MAADLPLLFESDEFIPPPSAAPAGARDVLGTLHAVLERVAEPVIIFCPHRATILFANPAVTSMFGLIAHDLGGSHLRRLFPSVWRDLVAAVREPDGRGTAKFETVHLAPDGAPMMIEAVASRAEYGAEDAAVCVLRDLTKLHRVTESLHESRLVNGLVSSVTSDGLWEWNLTTNSVEFSPQWKYLVGCGPGEVGVSPNEWFVRIHPDDVDRVHLEIAPLLEGAADAPLESRHRLLHKNGTYRWMLARIVAARSTSGEIRKLVGAHCDVTERRNAEEQLERKAFYDPLTDLPNRALFMERLTHAVQRARHQAGSAFAVFFVDLDRFKVINDSLGHLAGDRLLVQIARRLETCVRQTDTLARLGGDEFAILLGSIHSPDDARLVADRIHAELAVPFEIEGHAVFSSASIGIALSSGAPSKPEDFLREADLAMYRAKFSGKARHEVYDEAMHASVKQLLEIESDLRAAIERDELAVAYQPIIALASGRLAGFEALVRWCHPRRGLVPPSEFIPMAEETGLVADVDVAVLRKACGQVRDWQLQFPFCSHLTVSVNVSGRQFADRNLVAVVDEALAESRLDPRSLKVEITETALMENPESAAAVLQSLKARGIQLLIDDFGTGYSSLGYLMNFPIDTIKIDRSFVAKLDAESRRERVIVRSVARLARSLGLSIIAEGVETAEQLAQLKSLKCDFGQGYHFSRPLDAAAVPGYLIAERKCGGYFAGR